MSWVVAILCRPGLTENCQKELPELRGENEILHWQESSQHLLAANAVGSSLSSHQHSLTCRALWCWLVDYGVFRNKTDGKL